MVDHVVYHVVDHVVGTTENRTRARQKSYLNKGGTPNEQYTFRRVSLRRNLHEQLLHAKVLQDNWLVAAKRS